MYTRHQCLVCFVSPYLVSSPRLIVKAANGPCSFAVVPSIRTHNVCFIQARLFRCLATLLHPSTFAVPSTSPASVLHPSLRITPCFVQASDGEGPSILSIVAVCFIQARSLIKHVCFVFRVSASDGVLVDVLTLERMKAIPSSMVASSMLNTVVQVFVSTRGFMVHVWSHRPCLIPSSRYSLRKGVLDRICIPPQVCSHTCNPG